MTKTKGFTPKKKVSTVAKELVKAAVDEVTKDATDTPSESPANVAFKKTGTKAKVTAKATVTPQVTVAEAELELRGAQTRLAESAAVRVTARSQADANARRLSQALTDANAVALTNAGLAKVRAELQAKADSHVNAAMNAAATMEAALLPPVALTKAQLKAGIKAKAQGRANPSLLGVAWREPFPEAKLDKDGVDTVIVRAIPTQDIRINGTLKAAGVECTLPCSVAHAHAAALMAPRE